MQSSDYPSIYCSADELSLLSQKRFFLVLTAHLVLLIFAAILSLINISGSLIAILQLITLLSVLFCSIYLFSLRPDRLWYAGRAVAESIKTITWRYVSRAEPFQGDDTNARAHFSKSLKAIVEQNAEIFRAVTTRLDAPQITQVMETMRSQSLENRWNIYMQDRVSEQLAWYAKKANFNKGMYNKFFWALIFVNSIAVLCAIFRIIFSEQTFWPTDIFVATSASLLSWMQAKRFSELSASYALAAHEINFIKEQSFMPNNDQDFSLFVGDTENAFSREHTQWAARRDI
ncbi:DUF4231 domain-containing protein [Legionella pneumophila]|uniref:DUF4231 domain-containing protein n=1 Tax=Legionella pneumophila TaxID=446 RepID=UPI001A1FA1FD|nr:DUF4231 domain-containing protein [Legionella pneumophila]HAT9397997.1 DUF4231 domain-containing protein [Legionella pneumophila subsp. pneumophila]MCW8401100.1 DUF4231 domain-containing protein [Legionella pneumophila]MCZ4698241.1 DUF4231 domain-containing protein [Legionella pneumophila]MCZ4713645.1 DUF4231 domain-containing protein [Legionella pneumophila]MCZ4744061.1 DUF4231 domain-containing protein [Legionella pneumophila]